MVRFGYSFLSGLLGGQSIIFAKTVIELIKVTMFGKNQGIEYMCFANIDFYVYLVAMVTVLVAQTDILNSGLKHFEALKNCTGLHNILPNIWGYWRWSLL